MAPRRVMMPERPPIVSPRAAIRVEDPVRKHRIAVREVIDAIPGRPAGTIEASLTADELRQR